MLLTMVTAFTSFTSLPKQIFINDNICIKFINAEKAKILLNEKSILVSEMYISVLHVNNFRYLLIEIYKIINRESQSFLWDMFEPKPSVYSSFRYQTFLPSTRTQIYEVNSLAFRGSLL